MSRRFSGAQDEVRNYFDDRFEMVLSPVMLAIEKEVTGTDVGATSWTSPAQVEWMLGFIDSGPGSLHLDVGSGAGWPALQIAKIKGVRVVMSDLPFNGLAHGVTRAKNEGLDMSAVQASGSNLPFADGSFDSISHSDVLCCLTEKVEVISECRRLISEDGTMIFTVISISESATDEDVANLGRDNETVVSESPYPVLLERGGFDFERYDLTEKFHDTAERVLEARTKHYPGLVELLDSEEADGMLNRSRGNLQGIEQGVLERYLYVCKARS